MQLNEPFLPEDLHPHEGNPVNHRLIVCSLSLGEAGKHINKIPRTSQENAGKVPGKVPGNPGAIP